MAKDRLAFSDVASQARPGAHKATSVPAPSTPAPLQGSSTVPASTSPKKPAVSKDAGVYTPPVQQPVTPNTNPNALKTTGRSFLSGAIEGIENIVDAPRTIRAAMEAANAQYLKNDPTLKQIGRIGTQNIGSVAEQSERKAQELYDKAQDFDLFGESGRSYREETQRQIGKLGGAGQFFANLAWAGGEMAPDILASLATGGGATAALGGKAGAKLVAEKAGKTALERALASGVSKEAAERAATAAASKALTLPRSLGATTGLSAMALDVYDKTFTNDVENGADFNTAAQHAIGSAAIEVGTELMFGGIPGLGRGVAESTLRSVLASESATNAMKASASILAASGQTAELVSRFGANPVIKGVATAAAGITRFANTTSAGRALKVLAEMSGEGIEEVVAGVLSPYLERVTVNPEAENATPASLATDFLGGFLLGGFFSGTMHVVNRTLEAGKALHVDRNGDVVAEDTAATKAKAQEAAGETEAFRSADLPMLTPEEDMSTRNAIYFLLRKLQTEGLTADEAQTVGMGNTAVAPLIGIMEFNIPSPETTSIQQYDEFVHNDLLPTLQRNLENQRLDMAATSFVNAVASSEIPMVALKADEIADGVAYAYRQNNGLAGVSLIDVKEQIAAALNTELENGISAEDWAKLVEGRVRGLTLFGRLRDEGQDLSTLYSPAYMATADSYIEQQRRAARDPKLAGTVVATVDGITATFSLDDLAYRKFGVLYNDLEERDQQIISRVFAQAKEAAAFVAPAIEGVLEQYNELGKQFGFKVMVMPESLRVRTDGGVRNGMYSDGVIYINPDRALTKETVGYVVAHEIVHRAQEAGKSSELHELVLRVWDALGFDRYLYNGAEQARYSYQGIYEELVASGLYEDGTQAQNETDARILSYIIGDPYIASLVAENDRAFVKGLADFISSTIPKTPQGAVRRKKQQARADLNDAANGTLEEKQEERKPAAEKRRGRQSNRRSRSRKAEALAKADVKEELKTTDPPQEEQRPAEKKTTVKKSSKKAAPVEDVFTENKAATPPKEEQRPAEKKTTAKKSSKKAAPVEDVFTEKGKAKETAPPKEETAQAATKRSGAFYPVTESDPTERYLAIDEYSGNWPDKFYEDFQSEENVSVAVKGDRLVVKIGKTKKETAPMDEESLRSVFTALTGQELGAELPPAEEMAPPAEEMAPAVEGVFTQAQTTPPAEEMAPAAPPAEEMAPAAPPAEETAEGEPAKKIDTKLVERGVPVKDMPHLRIMIVPYLRGSQKNPRVRFGYEIHHENINNEITRKDKKAIGSQWKGKDGYLWYNFGRGTNKDARDFPNVWEEMTGEEFPELDAEAALAALLELRLSPEEKREAVSELASDLRADMLAEHGGAPDAALEDLRIARANERRNANSVRREAGAVAEAGLQQEAANPTWGVEEVSVPGYPNILLRRGSARNLTDALLARPADRQKGFTQKDKALLNRLAFKNVDVSTQEWFLGWGPSDLVSPSVAKGIYDAAAAKNEEAFQAPEEARSALRPKSELYLHPVRAERSSGIFLGVYEDESGDPQLVLVPMRKLLPHEKTYFSRLDFKQGGGLTLRRGVRQNEVKLSSKHLPYTRGYDPDMMRYLTGVNIGVEDLLALNDNPNADAMKPQEPEWEEFVPNTKQRNGRNKATGNELTKTTATLTDVWYPALFVEGDETGKDGVWFMRVSYPSDLIVRRYKPKGAKNFVYQSAPFDDSYWSYRVGRSAIPGRYSSLAYGRDQEDTESKPDEFQQYAPSGWNAAVTQFAQDGGPSPFTYKDSNAVASLAVSLNPESGNYEPVAYINKGESTHYLYGMEIIPGQNGLSEQAEEDLQTLGFEWNKGKTKMSRRFSKAMWDAMRSSESDDLEIMAALYDYKSLFDRRKTNSMEEGEMRMSLRQIPVLEDSELEKLGNTFEMIMLDGSVDTGVPYSDGTDPTGLYTDALTGILFSSVYDDVVQIRDEKSGVVLFDRSKPEETRRLELYDENEDYDWSDEEWSDADYDSYPGEDTDDGMAFYAPEITDEERALTSNQAAYRYARDAARENLLGVAEFSGADLAEIDAENRMYATNREEANYRLGPSRPRVYGVTQEYMLSQDELDEIFPVYRGPAQLSADEEARFRAEQAELARKRNAETRRDVRTSADDEARAELAERARQRFEADRFRRAQALVSREEQRRTDEEDVLFGTNNMGNIVRGGQAAVQAAAERRAKKEAELQNGNQANADLPVVPKELLPEDARENFKDSVGSEGPNDSLVNYYMQTPNGRVVRQPGDYGSAFYLTTRKPKVPGNQVRMLAQSERPIGFTSHFVSPDEIKDLLLAADEVAKYLSVPGNLWSTARKELWNKTMRAFSKNEELIALPYVHQFAGAISSMTTTADTPEVLGSLIRALGYDSVALPTGLVVFGADQLRMTASPSVQVQEGQDFAAMPVDIDSLFDQVSAAMAAEAQPEEDPNSADPGPVNPDTNDDVAEAHYNDLLDRYGAMEPGSGQVSPDRVVPKKNAANRNTRGFMRTVYEGKHTDERQAQRLRRTIATEAASYTPDSNKKELEAAYKWEAKFKSDLNPNALDLQKLYDGAMGLSYDSASDIAKGEVALAELCAEVRRYNQAGKLPPLGLCESVEALTAQLAAAATKHAQALQIFSMMNKLSPSGRLFLLERNLQYMKEDVRRYGKSVVNSLKDFQIPPNLKADLLNAETPEAAMKAEDEIIKAIADACPATIESRLVAWRYLSMLGNPRTHVRNIASNAVMWVERYFSTSLQGAAEDVFLRNGEERHYTAKKIPEHVHQFAVEQFPLVAPTIMFGGKLGFDTRITRERKPFGKSKVGEFYNKMAEVNSEGFKNSQNRFLRDFVGLENEDNVFAKHAFIRAFENYLTANNIDIEWLKRGSAEANEALHKAKAFAIGEAQEAVYRAASGLAKKLAQIENSSPLAHVLIGGIMPFKGVTVNVLKAGVKYSPLGFVNAINLYHKMANGEQIGVGASTRDVVMADFVGAISAGITGTALMALGLFFAAMGFMRGGGSDNDRENYYEQMQGYQPYSVQVLDSTYTLDWMTPTSFPLFAGVELYRLIEEKMENGEEGYDWNTLLDALSTMADPMTELSLLQGINQAINSYEDNKIGAYVTSSITNYLGQYIPTRWGQAARVIDPVRRTTYAPKDSAILGGKTAAQFINKMENKIPFLSKKNQPYVDQWGRTEENTGAFGTNNIIDRIAGQAVAPWYQNTIHTTAADDVVAQVYAKTGDTTVMPKTPSSYFKIGDKTYYLTEDEYTALKLMEGSMANDYVAAGATSLVFNSLSPDEQAKCLKDIYTFTSSAGKVWFTEQRGIDYDGKSDAAKDIATLIQAQSLGIAPIDYFAIKHQMNSFTAKDKNGKTVSGLKKKRQVEYANLLGLSNDQRALFM